MLVKCEYWLKGVDPDPEVPDVTQGIALRQEPVHCPFLHIPSPLTKKE